MKWVQLTIRCCGESVFCPYNTLPPLKINVIIIVFCFFFFLLSFCQLVCSRKQDYLVLPGLLVWHLEARGGAGMMQRRCQPSWRLCFFCIYRFKQQYVASTQSCAPKCPCGGVLRRCRFVSQAHRAGCFGMCEPESCRLGTAERCCDEIRIRTVLASFSIQDVRTGGGPEASLLFF